MSLSGIRHSTSSRRTGLHIMLGLQLLACLLLHAGPARAQQQEPNCTPGNSLDLQFGAVTPAGKDATSNTLGYTCHNNITPLQTVYFRLCLFKDPGNWSSDQINPRHMHSFDPVADMAYDLYSDPNRTQLLGPEGRGYPVYSWTIEVPPNTSATHTIPVYGRVHPGQTLPAGNYQEQQVTGVLRYRYDTDGFPPSGSECLSGGLGGNSVPTTSSGILATFENTCAVGIATDLDFGEVSSLTDGHEQTSTINLHCPSSTTAWHLGLNDGEHGPDGQRRMANADGTLFVEYELYRDSSRTQRWGNTDDTDVDGTGTGIVQTVTVYGRTSLQSPTPPPGVYSDTITVTLTF